MRFSADEVRRAKTERQAANVLNVQCQRCGNDYWIRAHEIAAGTIEPAPELEAADGVRLDVAAVSAIP